MIIGRHIRDYSLPIASYGSAGGIVRIGIDSLRGRSIEGLIIGRQSDAMIQLRGKKLEIDWERQPRRPTVVSLTTIF